MRFCKKPVIIEATQWHKHGDHPNVHRTAYDAIPAIGKDAQVVPPDHKYGYIDTLEGRMLVSPGDWIIKGIKGEFYPCKPDIFIMTYEPATCLCDTLQPGAICRTCQLFRDQRAAMDKEGAD